MLYPVTKIEFNDLLVLGNGVLKTYNKFIRQHSPEFFSDYFRGDFNSLSEDQKLRSVRKTMDNIMLEVRVICTVYCKSGKYSMLALLSALGLQFLWLVTSLVVRAK